jgi:ATP-binding cassette subfamily C (CFTR/MRP) protein 4
LTYASQESWIFEGTLQQNILFGKPYDKDWYNKVVEACALRRDLQLLPYGDQTFVGDKGTCLSGGQRARINLARYENVCLFVTQMISEIHLTTKVKQCLLSTHRLHRAVYSNADIILLDDPLSAVDTKVAKQIFNECIRKLLKNKTCILVTHQTQFLPKMDKVLMLENGTMAACGTYTELNERGFNFSGNYVNGVTETLRKEELKRIESFPTWNEEIDDGEYYGENDGYTKYNSFFNRIT